MPSGVPRITSSGSMGSGAMGSGSLGSARTPQHAPAAALRSDIKRLAALAAGASESDADASPPNSARSARSTGGTSVAHQDDVADLVRKSTEGLPEALRALLATRRKAVEELVEHGAMGPAEAAAAQCKWPAPRGIPDVDVSDASLGGSATGRVVGSSRDSLRRFARAHCGDAADVVRRVRKLAGAMAHSSSIDSLAGSSGGADAGHGNPTMSAFLGNSRSTRAPMVDAWVQYAGLWKEASFTASLIAAAHPPEVLVCGGDVACDELAAGAWGAIGMVVTSLALLLKGSPPRLVQSEALDAVVAVCRGCLASSWQYLLCRIDPSAAPPFAHAGRNPRHATRVLPMDLVDPAALVGAEVMRDAAALLQHAELSSLGDDTESAVSLTGTRAPAALAGDAAKALVATIDGVRAAGLRACGEAVHRLMANVLCPDYAGQKWHIGSPFYRGTQASHAVRMAHLAVHMHWLAPLQRCALAAEDFSAVHAPCVAPPGSLVAPAMGAVVNTFASHWVEMVARIKASAVRGAQLATDAAYVVRSLRSLRGVVQPAAMKAADRHLLRLLAIVAVRTSPLVRFARLLGEALEVEIPAALQRKPAAAAAEGDATPLPEGDQPPDAAAPEGEEQERPPGADDTGRLIWNPQATRLNAATADALRDPLQWYSFGPSAAAGLSNPHAEIVAAIPHADGDVAAITRGRWEGVLVDFLASDDGPCSLQHQLGLRPELTPGGLPPQEEDEVAAVDTLHKIRAALAESSAADAPAAKAPVVA